MFKIDPPRRLYKQPEYKDELIQEKIKEKFEKLVGKIYIVITDMKFLEAIIYMFHIAKGDDIHMVYDGSKSGLNAAIYTP